MSSSRSSRFLALSALLSACGSSELLERQTEVGSAQARLFAGATLTFAANWTQTAAPTPSFGAPVRIVYAASRLPKCRGPGWAVTAFWTLNGLPAGSLPVAGKGAAVMPVLAALPMAGDLAVWFQNTDGTGCSAYDSSLGANYHFAVAAPANAPGWVGNAASIIDRETCPSGSFNRCSGSPNPLEGGFTFDTWSRQRAGFARAFFEVWQQAVTDHINPDLWKQLDVELHSRLGASGDFQVSYVNFAEYTGNNARYAVDLRGVDPLGGLHGGALTDRTQCPTFPVTVSADRQYVEAELQYYFTVNGVGLQPAAGGVFHGRFQNYLGLYAVCGY